MFVFFIIFVVKIAKIYSMAVSFEAEHDAVTYVVIRWHVWRNGEGSNRVVLVSMWYTSMM